MNKELKEAAIRILESRQKFDFVKNSKEVKTYKQLNFFLKNQNKNEKHKKVAEAFELYKGQHFLSKAIDAVKLEIEPPEDLKPEITKAFEKAKEFDAKQPNAELDEKEALTQTLEHYKKILAQHEAGEEFQWHKPWRSQAILGFPENLKGRKYDGGNIAALSAIQQEEGLSVPVWLTAGDLRDFDIDPNPLLNQPTAFVNFKSTAYAVRGDDKAPLIYKKQYEELSEEEQEAYREVKFVKSSPVWHPDHLSDQLSGNEKWQEVKEKNKYFILLSNLDTPEAAIQFYHGKVREAVADLEAAAAECGVEIKEHNSACFYSPASDSISMVNEDKFISDVAYVGTLAHEMVHSTGHHSRLNRNMTGAFGSHNYGYEELVAESGANQFMLRYNLPAALDKESAAYIVNWAEKLKGTKNQKRGLFEAAMAQGGKASQFLVEKKDEYENSLKHNTANRLEHEQKKKRRMDFSM
jgi:antirestriction protein ArdC